MIRAMFEENVRKTEARGLVQWDYGQILQIEGLKGNRSCRGSFCCKRMQCKSRDLYCNYRRKQDPCRYPGQTAGSWKRLDCICVYCRCDERENCQNY